MKYAKEILILKNLRGVGNAKINTKYVPLLKQNIPYDEFISQLIEWPLEIVEESERCAQDIIDLSMSNGIKIITCFDEDYPKDFRTLGSKMPPIIYIRGKMGVSDGIRLGVVGTRKPTAESEKVEKALIAGLVDKSTVIVSGLAAGCDAVAHSCALSEGLRTVAILPSGLNSITPADNRVLANNIVEDGGCLISEYPPQMQASKYTFVERDALIACYADAMLAIECDINSGTMHTIKASHEQRKVIGVVKAAKGQVSPGNDFIISQYHGKEISSSADLNKLIESASKPVVMEQMVLPFMGGDIL